MLLIKRSFLPNHLNFSKNVLKYRLLSVNLNQDLDADTDKLRKIDNESSNIFKNVIEKIESKTRKEGNVDVFLLKNAIIDIPKIKPDMKESLILLKCCGSILLNKSKKEKISLLNQIWSSLKSVNPDLKILHYNLLIKIYIENDHKFDEDQMLNEIKNAGLEANSKTYEILIEKFCKEGNLNKTTDYLEKMNSLNLSLTKPIFDSLILCHLINKDIKSAEETLDVMKESNLYPDKKTLKNLIIGYSKNLDQNDLYEKIDKLLLKFKTRLNINEIIEILNSLPETNKRIEEKLFSYLKYEENFMNDVTNNVYGLILNKNYELSTYLLENHISKTILDRHIKKLISLLTKSDESLESCKNFLNYLQKFIDGSNVKEIAFVFSLKNIDNDFKKSIKFLNISEDNKTNVKYAFYLELLKKYQNEDQIMYLIENYLKNNYSLSFIKKRIIPIVENNVINFIDEYTKKYGNNNILNSSAFCYYLDNQEIKKAIEIKKKFFISYDILNNNYLIEKFKMFVSEKKEDLDLFLNLVFPKIIRDENFKIDILKESEKIDENLLKSIYKNYQLNNILIPETYAKNFDQLVKENKKNFEEKFLTKLDNCETIEELEKIKSQFNNFYTNKAFIHFVQKEDYTKAKVFFDPSFKLKSFAIFNFFKLKLINEDNKKEILKSFFSNLTIIENLKQKDTSKIYKAKFFELFDTIKNDDSLVYFYCQNLSKLINDSVYLDLLLKFYVETKNQNLAEEIINLNLYLLDNNFNRIFQTMTVFENDTKLLQKFTNDCLEKIDQNTIYSNLIIIFLKKNRINQALKVLNSSNFSFKIDNYNSLFNYLFSSDKELLKKVFIFFCKNYNQKQFLLNYIYEFSKSKDSKLFQEIIEELRNTQKAESFDNQINTNETLNDFYKLVDEIIGGYKIISLNSECNLVDKLMELENYDKATNLIDVMLKNERFPKPSLMKKYLQNLVTIGRTDLIEKIEPNLPKPLKESEFYENNKLLGNLSKMNSDNEIKENLDKMNFFSYELIEQILKTKPGKDNLLIEIFKNKKNSITFINYVWLYYMKNKMFDKANEVFVENSELKKNLICQPLLNIISQKNDLELAEKLVEFSNDLKLNTIQSIYYTYLKTCLNLNELEKAENFLKKSSKSIITNNDIKALVMKLNEELVKKFKTDAQNLES